MNTACFQVMTVLAQSGKTVPPPNDSSYFFLVWGIILIGIAMVLFVLEVLLPTAGIIALLSGLCLIGGIVMLFGFNTTVGLIGCALTLLALPFLFGFAIKIWPHTFIAKMITLKNETNRSEELDLPVSGTDIQQGMKGTALTPLRPVGTCLIEGEREECIANAGIIEKGAEIEVVLVDGMQIKVKAITPEPTA
ncbi:hypothetical protein [Poriferisphaera sp. WC338]|uniref:NfeD family protein n=1 Tax=Poriferisphaera sp. WC338 TaxID=3425129 RepID=UPI003D816238